MKIQKTHKTIRLKGYDYSQDGWYFITICSHQFDEIFGEITENENIKLSDLGEIIEHQWLKSEGMRPKLTIDVY